MHVESCCFANLNLLLFCRSRSRWPRRCLSSLLLLACSRRSDSRVREKNLTRSSLTAALYYLHAWNRLCYCSWLHPKLRLHWAVGVPKWAGIAGALRHLHHGWRLRLIYLHPHIVKKVFLNLKRNILEKKNTTNLLTHWWSVSLFVLLTANKRWKLHRLTDRWMTDKWLEKWMTHFW